MVFIFESLVQHICIGCVHARHKTVMGSRVHLISSDNDGMYAPARSRTRIPYASHNTVQARERSAALDRSRSIPAPLGSAEAQTQQMRRPSSVPAPLGSAEAQTQRMRMSYSASWRNLSVLGLLLCLVSMAMFRKTVPPHVQALTETVEVLHKLPHGENDQRASEGQRSDVLQRSFAQESQERVEAQLMQQAMKKGLAEAQGGDADGMHAGRRSAPPAVSAGSSSLPFDSLGPVLLGKDGRLRRVPYWEEMGVEERRTVAAQVAQRNVQRKAALVAAEARGQAQTDGSGDRKLRHPWRAISAKFCGMSRGVRRLLKTLFSFPWTKRKPTKASADADAGEREAVARVEAPSRLHERGVEAALEAVAGADFAAAATLIESAGAGIWKSMLKMDFAPQYVPLIRSGSKQATTRCLQSEPQLAQISPNAHIGATCVRCTLAEHGASPDQPFATLRVNRAISTPFDALGDDLAAEEGFVGGARELQEALRGFYPNLSAESDVTVFHFSLLEEPTKLAST